MASGISIQAGEGEFLEQTKSPPFHQPGERPNDRLFRQLHADRAPHREREIAHIAAQL